MDLLIFCFKSKAKLFKAFQNTLMVAIILYFPFSCGLVSTFPSKNSIGMKVRLNVSIPKKNQIEILITGLDTIVFDSTYVYYSLNSQISLTLDSNTRQLSFKTSDTINTIIDSIREKTTYNFTVFAKDHNGMTSSNALFISIKTPDWTPPAPVDSLQITFTGGSWVSLKWKKVKEVDVSSIGVWWAYNSLDIDSLKKWSWFKPNINDSRISNLEQKKKLFIGVVARDSGGNLSSDSGMSHISVFLPDTIAPDNVHNLIQTFLNDSSFILTWDRDTSDSNDVMELQISFRLDTFPIVPNDPLAILKIKNKKSISDTLTNLKKKIPYYISLFTKDSSGNWNANADTARIKVILMPIQNITNLSAVSDTGHKIHLTWTPSKSASAKLVFIGYRTDGIYPDKDTNKWEGKIRFNTTDSLGVFSSLKEKNTYHIGAFVIDPANNWSDSSVSARAITRTLDETPPDNVHNLIQSFLNDSSITLSWDTTVSNDIKELQISFRLDTFPMVPNDPAAFLKTKSGNPSSDTITGLKLNTAYYFSIFVKDSSGNWNVDTNIARLKVYLPDNTPPQNVTNLSAVSDTGRKIRLTWTPSKSTSAKLVLIGYRTDGIFPDKDTNKWEGKIRFNTTDSSGVFSSLKEKTTHHIGAFIIDIANHWSDASKSARAIAKTLDETPPDNVHSLEATLKDSIGVIITWKKPDSIDIEKILIGFTNNSSYAIGPIEKMACKTLLSTDTTCTLNTLAGNTTYYIAAFAVDSIGLKSTSTAESRDTIEIPDNLTNIFNIFVKALSDTSAELQWTIANLQQVDSAIFCFRDDSTFPINNTNCKIRKSYNASKLYATVYSLKEKTTYFISAFFKHDSIILNDFGAHAIITTPDITRPVNVTNLSDSILNDSSVILTWTSSITNDVKDILISFRTDMYPLTPEDPAAFSRIKPRNASCDTIVGLKQKIPYYTSFFVKDSSGNWNSDSDTARVIIVLRDRTPPYNITNLFKFSITGTMVILHWIKSTSTDADSIVLCYRTDGRFPRNKDDAIWKTNLTNSITVDTIEGLNEKTNYYFSAFVSDSADNWSDTSASAQILVKTGDTTPPVNVTLFDAKLIDVSSIELSWLPSQSTDADSTVIRYKIGGSYPIDPTDGLLYKKYKAHIGTFLVKDTVKGLYEKTLYNFSVFTKDSSGNWSSDLVWDSIKTPDKTPPQNVIGFTAKLEGSDISLSWLPSSSEDADSMAFCYRIDTFPKSPSDGLLQKRLKASESNYLCIGLGDTITKYFGAFVVDSFGNLSFISPSAQAIYIHPPVADAGHDTSYLMLFGTVTDSVRLNGSNSWFANGLQRYYYWENAANNPLIINLENVVNPAFMPIVPGIYAFILRVFDGMQYSVADQVRINLFKPKIYVSYATPGAYPTIREALAIAEKGDTILIGQGTYHDTVTVTTSDITLLGVDRNNSIIDGKIDNNYVGIPLRLRNVKNVDIKNLFITNGGPFDSCAGIVCIGCSNILIENNNICKNFTDGIRCFNSAPVYVRDNLIKENQFNGIRTQNTQILIMHNQLVSNCLFTGAEVADIAVERDNNQNKLVTIIDNIFQDGHLDQIKILSNLEVVVRDNIINSDYRFGVYSTDGCHARLYMERNRFSSKNVTTVFCHDLDSVFTSGNSFTMAQKTINQKGMDLVRCNKGTIEKDTFSGYWNGVKTYMESGSQDPLVIQNCLFKNNTTGILAIGTKAPVVRQDNQFIELDGGYIDSTSH